LLSINCTACRVYNMCLRKKGCNAGTGIVLKRICSDFVCRIFNQYIFLKENILQIPVVFALGTGNDGFLIHYFTTLVIYAYIGGHIIFKTGSSKYHAAVGEFYITIQMSHLCSAKIF